MSTPSVTPVESSTLIKTPELLAPAGNWDCAITAVENGADAIYFGLDKFNARMRSQNFVESDLPELMAYLHRRGVKGYVTLNTLIFTSELAAVEQYLRSIIAAGVDAAIVQDVGLCQLIWQLSPDFPIHGSTQMTVTSAAGVEFAQNLGCDLVVLARECSIKEINKIQQELGQQKISMPLEVFVHGALCVAYSGQCLTSESLGGRSANRGECAQACRMPYEMIVDGRPFDLSDRRYLLSPQDLAGLPVLPDLIKAGVVSLKIEGRLKQPEYVASVTQVYRQAIDRAVQGIEQDISDQEKYQLEMAFSRGLYTGWLDGIDNQSLVHGRFGKKRGVFLGEIKQIRDGRDKQVILHLEAPLKAGDGVVFDQGKPADREQGGRVYAVETQGKDTIVTFGRRDVDLRRVRVGDRLWKTSDPELDKKLRQTFTSEKIQFQRPITIEIHGEIGEKLTAIARDGQGNIVQVRSEILLDTAIKKPLTTERLTEQFGRLGNTPFYLQHLENNLLGEAILPVSELNRIRREIVSQLETLRAQPKRWQLNSNASYRSLLPTVEKIAPQAAQIIVLVRNLAQLKAVLKTNIQTIYCEFENPINYREAVKLAQQTEQQPEIWVAPPRITKPKEQYILNQVLSSQADGYLIRNYDQLKFFKNERITADFSLNISNPISANYFKQTFPLERLTASYDLNIHQLESLLKKAPPHWFEITIHQHMPMFHMEHCVFCAFLSDGTDFTNCGRPCESHEVKLGDRTGIEHVLVADAGCRNTVFNGTAQTGAEYMQHFIDLGVQHFRVEFVDESPAEITKTVDLYQKLLTGKISGAQLWQTLKLQNQLGVTRGSLE
ncbi:MULTISPECIES: U32 family peptidase [Cyanophyceae]|uniref:U32 family peptidase n=1 Tax=Cyanophyceae TaxID=3028117 RepID=UPI00016DC85B|nr:MULTISPECIES: U32 family peptidase [Cyanophyceae]ACA99189.1 peptidase, U32 family [Picosynechococcus sp. PCC 7002]SMH33956.1 putative protease [Picosynechococcus sp. OG1]SMQ84508.1 putative protease [Synechococcus sp. 7002]